MSQARSGHRAIEPDHSTGRVFFLPMLRFKYIRPELKLVDAERGIFAPVVISDETRDRDGDIIRQEFWDFTDFQKHPALVASHEYHDLFNQIGEWHDIEVKGKKTWGSPQYYVGQGNKQADWAFTLALKGRAAYSVGFMPDWDKAVKLDDGEDFFPSFEFRGQTLLETSQVVIPSNPNALQQVKGMNPHPIVSAIVDEALAESTGETQATKPLHELIDLDTLAAKVAEELCPLLAQLIIVVRGPIASHSTATSEDAWDGPANEARLSNEAGASTYRRAYAWVDSDKDADTKAAYKFIHHEVASDGTVGAANLIACSTGIGILNGGRGGTTIPDADKQGVYNHLSRHLKDADREPPELQSLTSPVLTFFHGVKASNKVPWLAYAGPQEDGGT